MRQAGSLPVEAEARRFCLYLIAHGIEVNLEADGGAWTIWVRDEDRLAEAKQALAEFQADPQAAKFQGLEQQAEARLRAEIAKQKKRQENVVDVRGRWAANSRAPSTKRAPLTTALIVISIVVAVLTNLGQAKTGSVQRALMFRDPVKMEADFRQSGGDPAALSPWTDIRQGQVWRLVTPIFLHFSITHIFFNCYMLFFLGGQVEDRLGTPFTLALVLASAVLPDAAQAYFVHPMFGGLSGVTYAMTGFIGVRMLRPGAERYLVDNFTIILALVFFVLGILNDLPGFDQSLRGLLPRGGVANWCHGVGLAVGAAFAAVTPLVRRGG